MIARDRRKEVPFTMAIENIKLMHDVTPEHLSIETIKLKFDKKTEEGRQETVKMENSPEGTKKRSRRPSIKVSLVSNVCTARILTKTENSLKIIRRHMH